jgi:cytochrome c peroxidase
LSRFGARGSPFATSAHATGRRTFRYFTNREGARQVQPLPGMRITPRIGLELASVVLASSFMGCGNSDPPADAPVTTPPIYNPYPPGLLPPDLDSEINRVTAEIDSIFLGALAQWKALPAPTLAGNPVSLQNTGLRLVQILGKLELFDKTISVNKNVACSFCHMPYAGFSGPISSVNATTVAYPGSVHFRFGKRKPQAYTYSPFYPALDFNLTQQDFYGGNFWDLRATGWKIQSADAEQAQHPPVDTQEHGFPDTACVVFAISNSQYRPLFELIYGNQAFDIAWPADTATICSTPGGDATLMGNPTPINLSTIDRGRANTTFDQFALSVDAYERSEDVSAFSSKFDAFLAGQYQLTADEMAGWQLFRGKANCNTCHLDGTSNGGTVMKIASKTPLFTDFTSANLGIPRNPMDPIYFENVADPFGFTANPAGMGFKDLGVGFFLRSEQGGVNPNADWTPLAPKYDGKMQVATARNSDMRPCPTFVKAYMHNGYLKSLKEVVHFYNTRDAFPGAVCTPATEKITCWPPPEVTANLSMSLGNLGLTDAEENQVVVFLQALTDGFTRPYTDFGTFTGTCP